MSKVNKVHSVNNSYYAKQSRARHIHQEKYLEKQLKQSKKTNLSNLDPAKNYDSFLSAALTGIKKVFKKFI